MAAAGAAFAEFYARQTTLTNNFAKTTVDAWNNTTQSIGFATTAWEEEITAVMDERDASLRAFKDKTDAAKALRKEYEINKALADFFSFDDPLGGAKKPRGNDNASQRAEYRTDDEAEDGHRESDEHRGPRTVDHAAQHIASQIVGSEPVR